MKIVNLRVKTSFLLMGIILFFIPMRINAQDPVEVKFLTNHELNLETFFPYLLLREALQRTQTPYELKIVFQKDVNVLDGKPISLTWLKQDQDDFDIVFSGAIPQYEHNVRAVYFPIYRGLLSYRVMAIRADMQDEFHDIETLEELKNYIVLQGPGWTDTKILRDQGFRVLTARYGELYDMLLAGEGDFFSRGILEVGEIENYNNPNIILDEAIYMYYPLASYYHVAPDNKELADDLLAALTGMVEDGSYEELMKSFIKAQNLPFKIDLDSRKGFNITNNDITNETRKAVEDWFFTPEEISQLVE